MRGNFNLLPRAVRTANFTGDPKAGMGNTDELIVQVNVHAAPGGGTPSLTVVVEDSIDNGATWNTIDTFPAITAAGATRRAITAAYGDSIRVRGTMTGTTPSFDVSVDAYAE